MKVWGGIDPGNTGALAYIFEDQRIEIYDAPTEQVQSGKRTRTVLLPSDMWTLLYGTAHLHTLTVYLEKVAAMPSQSPNSMFTFGCGYGMWQGVLAAVRIPYTLVTPQRWKREMMAGMGKDKGASIVQAKRLFPRVSDQLTRKKDDGRADALLLAELCRKEQP